jgi:four helix bundle protein
MPDPAPIFPKTYDLLTWLIPHTLNFPRSQRFVVTKRLQDALLDFQEHIIEANRASGAARVTLLRQADADLDKVRLYLRLAARWEWLDEGQYRHVSLMIQELGKMLGGWIKKPHGTPAAAQAAASEAGTG